MKRVRCARFRVFGCGLLQSALLATLVAVLALPSTAGAQRAKYQQMQEKLRDQSQFRLFSSPTVVLAVNQFQCGLRNQGDTCSNVFNSPTGGGGFWPTASSNQYMFNAGLNLAGIIPPDAGFAWAGDTVGAYFFDARGTQAHGSPITEIFNSLDPDDLANWPDVGSVSDFPEATAFVTDEALFDPVLIGEKAASQQDTWVVYWDGDPAFLANRQHPMGVAVEQRTLAWNFPGIEATVFFIYKFRNVTNNAEFQRLNEAQFGIPLPDEGWRIDSIYVSFDNDPDVTNDFDRNYSTAVLPFDMGLAYECTRTRAALELSSPIRSASRSCGASSPATATRGSVTRRALSRIPRSGASASWRRSRRIRVSSKPPAPSHSMRVKRRRLWWP